MRLTTALNSIRKVPKTFANFPDKYIKKQTEFIEWKPPKGVIYQPITIRWRYRAYYDKYRPWESQFINMNAPNVHQPRIWVEPFEIFPVFKGDRVQILVGKDKGKIGTASYIVKERNWVFVYGLNTTTKEFRSRDKKEELEMIMTEEQPLLYPREVCLIDPSDKLPADVKWRYDEEGNRVRVSMRTGRILELPPETFATFDYKTPAEYIEREKDTRNEQVCQQTYLPALKTFEMDIAEQMGVKEDRIPHKVFWY